MNAEKNQENNLYNDYNNVKENKNLHNTNQFIDQL